jgi:hypothetical protein
MTTNFNPSPLEALTRVLNSLEEKGFLNFEEVSISKKEIEDAIAALSQSPSEHLEGFSQDEINYAFDCVRPPMLICNPGSEDDLLESLRSLDVTNSSILISDNDGYCFEPILVEESNQRYLWKYENKYLYYGQINGIFLATKEEIDLVFTKPRTLHLGEILGKHSDVEITVTKADFTKLPSDHIPEKYLKDFCMGYDILEAFLEPHKDEIKYVTNESDVKAYLKDNDMEE